MILYTHNINRNDKSIQIIKIPRTMNLSKYIVCSNNFRHWCVSHFQLTYLNERKYVWIRRDVLCDKTCFENKCEYEANDLCSCLYFPFLCKFRIINILIVENSLVQSNLLTMTILKKDNMWPLLSDGLFSGGCLF